MSYIKAIARAGREVVIFVGMMAGMYLLPGVVVLVLALPFLIIGNCGEAAH